MPAILVRQRRARECICGCVSVWNGNIFPAYVCTQCDVHSAVHSHRRRVMCGCVFVSMCVDVFVRPRRTPRHAEHTYVYSDSLIDRADLPHCLSLGGFGRCECILYIVYTIHTYVHAYRRQHPFYTRVHTSIHMKIW